MSEAIDSTMEVPPGKQAEESDPDVAGLLPLAKGARPVPVAEQSNRECLPIMGENPFIAQARQAEIPNKVEGRAIEQPLSPTTGRKGMRRSRTLMRGMGSSSFLKRAAPSLDQLHQWRNLHQPITVDCAQQSKGILHRASAAEDHSISLSRALQAPTAAAPPRPGRQHTPMSQLRFLQQISSTGAKKHSPRPFGGGRRKLGKSKILRTLLVPKAKGTRVRRRPKLKISSSNKSGLRAVKYFPRKKATIAKDKDRNTRASTQLPEAKPSAERLHPLLQLPPLPHQCKHLRNILQTIESCRREFSPPLLARLEAAIAKFQPQLGQSSDQSDKIILLLERAQRKAAEMHQEFRKLPQVVTEAVEVASQIPLEQPTKLLELLQFLASVSIFVEVRRGLDILIFIADYIAHMRSQNSATYTCRLQLALERHPTIVRECVQGISIAVMRSYRRFESMLQRDVETAASIGTAVDPTCGTSNDIDGYNRTLRGLVAHVGLDEVALAHVDEIDFTVTECLRVEEGLSRVCQECERGIEGTPDPEAHRKSVHRGGSSHHRRKRSNSGPLWKYMPYSHKKTLTKQLRILLRSGRELGLHPSLHIVKHSSNTAQALKRHLAHGTPEHSSHGNSGHHSRHNSRSDNASSNSSHRNSQKRKKKKKKVKTVEILFIEHDDVSHTDDVRESPDPKLTNGQTPTTSLDAPAGNDESKADCLGFEGLPASSADCAQFANLTISPAESPDSEGSRSILFIDTSPVNDSDDDVDDDDLAEVDTAGVSPGLHEDSSSATASTAVFAIGDTVMAQYMGGDVTFPAVITGVNLHGTFNIQYEDGDEENNVPGSRLLHFDS